MKLDRVTMRSKFGLSFNKPSLTKQSEKNSCDINKIVQKYIKTGVMPHVRNSVELLYLDATAIPDYQSALNIVIESEASFNSLPAQVRAHFDNDPAKFVSAFQAELPEDTSEILVEYGLMSKPVKSQQDNEIVVEAVSTPNS